MPKDFRALLIPVEGPISAVRIRENDLAQLQEFVGGYIEAIGLPDFIADSGRATCYVNEDGKNHQLPFNERATDFLVPGVGLFYGDYIAGPMLVCGFRPLIGDHCDIPSGVERRIRLIEVEATGRVVR